jgi:hypothetical protein
MMITEYGQVGTFSAENDYRLKMLQNYRDYSKLMDFKKIVEKSFYPIQPLAGIFI